MIVIFPYISTAAARIILVNGTSCAGKSTLSKKLHEKIQGSHLVSWDDEVERFCKQTGCQETDELSHKIRIKIVDDAIAQAANKTVIIDAIVDDIALLQKLYDVKATLVLVYAPLATLMERNEQRSKKLNRPETRNQQCRAFIIETFSKLYVSSNASVHQLEPVIRVFFEQQKLPMTHYCYLNEILEKAKIHFFEKTEQQIVFIQPRFVHYTFVLNQNHLDAAGIDQTLTRIMSGNA